MLLRRYQAGAVVPPWMTSGTQKNQPIMPAHKKTWAEMMAEAELERVNEAKGITKPNYQPPNPLPTRDESNSGLDEAIKDGTLKPIDMVALRLRNREDLDPLERIAVDFYNMNNPQKDLRSQEEIIAERRNNLIPLTPGQDTVYRPATVPLSNKYAEEREIFRQKNLAWQAEQRAKKSATSGILYKNTKTQI